MIIQDVVDQLRYGELSQADFGFRGGSDIAEEDYLVFATHINLALTALHKRFNIKQNELILQQFEGREYYPLTSEFAASQNSGVLDINHFIDDVTSPKTYDTDSAPYQDDLLRIERVIDEAECEQWLNAPNEEFSIFTPKYNLLQIPFANDEKQFSVIYRAKHPKIVPDAMFLTAEVDLPEAYLEPLLLHVAARYHAAIPAIDGVNEGNNYMNKYELACQQIEEFGLNVKDDPTNYKLYGNGWV